MFYSGLLTEGGRKETDLREAASLRQQRRMKQAVQFIHKDSADLLPLDGLRKLGSSKDTVSPRAPEPASGPPRPRGARPARRRPPTRCCWGFLSMHPPPQVSQGPSPRPHPACLRPASWPPGPAFPLFTGREPRSQGGLAGGVSAGPRGLLVGVRGGRSGKGGSWPSPLQVTLVDPTSPLRKISSRLIWAFPSFDLAS